MGTRCLEWYSNIVYFIILELLTHFSTRGARDRGLRIYKGEPDSSKEFPFVVILQTNTGFRSCTGSLIEARWILTAGHCLHQRQAEQIIIKYGDYTRLTSESKLYRKVIKIIVHPNYPYKNYNSPLYDIGLLFVERVPLKYYARLGAFDHKTLFGLPAKYAGFGLITKKIHPKLSNESLIQMELTPLQVGDAVMIPCESVFGLRNAFFKYSAVCVTPKCSNKEQQARPGDSGGPLVHDGRLLAVCSGVKQSPISHLSEENGRSFPSLQRLKIDKERMEEEGLYAEGTLALVLRISRWIGITPVNVSRAGAGWRFHVSTPMAILQGVVMTLLNLMQLTAIVLDFCQSPGKRIRAKASALKIFVWFSYIATVMIIASMAVYRGIAHMRRLKRVLAQLDQIKHDLNMNRASTKAENIKSAFIVILLMWAAAVFITDFLRYYLYHSSRANEEKMWIIIWFTLVFYIADFQGVLAAVKWACIVLAVNDAAASLNHRMQWLLNESTLLSPPSEAEFLIRRLALSHERIGAIMRGMNDTYGRMLGIVLMSEFLRLVLLLIQYDALGIPLCLNWWLVRMAVLMLTIEPCHWAHAQRKYTVILTSHLILHLAPKCKRLSKELEQFAKQLMLSNAKFQTLQAYTLDRQLTSKQKTEQFGIFLLHHSHAQLDTLGLYFGRGEIVRMPPPLQKLMTPIHKTIHVKTN